MPAKQTPEPIRFRELRLPKIPYPYRNFEQREAPTITMFAADIRPQPPAEPPPLRSYEQGDTANWNSPEPGKRAAHLNRARRRAKKEVTA
ncbi:MAG: hypothetical protein MZV65_39615 [Chromatiales bacterium]|nr:hypothetical protein [Chromatiales bacterium]MCK7581145.1 hypothetical protein [Chromatiales bacterium]